MSEFDVSAQPRNELGKGAVRRMRREGRVPGILYGAGKDPQPIWVKDNELRKSLESEAFFSHILNVQVDGASTQAVLKDLQRDPGSYEVRHVDFMRVQATERLTMRVPVHLLNEETCPGRRAGGVISHLLTEVEVTCLPRDLPEFLTVDMALVNVGEGVHLSGMVLPAGVTLAHAIEDAQHDHVVVSVTEAHDLDVEPEEEEEEGGEVSED
jgi:large subunit ribosomal protein L25